MKPFLLLMPLLLLVRPASAQIRDSLDKELSISGGYQHMGSEGSSSSSSAILLSPRLGFFVHRGLEIEPEVTLLAGSGIDAVYILNGLVSYNFPTSSGGMPFILAGYGIANTVPVFGVPVGEIGFAVGVLNIGGGMKIFIKDDVAIRLEYRYQNFSGSEERSTFYGSYTQDVDLTFHSILFGFSVFY